MKYLDGVAFGLLLLGGLNWGLVGLYEWDLVAEALGEELGMTSAASESVYILLGASAVYWLCRLPTHLRRPTYEPRGPRPSALEGAEGLRRR